MRIAFIRQGFIGVLALLGALSVGSASAGTLVMNQTLQHEGITRYFDVYVPDAPLSPAPLYFVLHGGNQDKSASAGGAMSELLLLADLDGFYVVFPNATEPGSGLSGVDGNYHWNDCRNDAGTSASFADDVGFVSAMIDWMHVQYTIDPQRIYSVGGSNGGMMSYRLAIELSHRIAGIAALIANWPANSECPVQPKHPRTIVMFNGTGEGYWMPYAGGQITGDKGLSLSAEATRDLFVGYLGANPTPAIDFFTDLDSSDGGLVERQVYAQGAEGHSVVFYKVNGAGHVLPSIAHPVPPLAEAFFGKQNHDLESAEEVVDQLGVVTLPEPSGGVAWWLGWFWLAALGRWRESRA